MDAGEFVNGMPGFVDTSALDTLVADVLSDADVDYWLGSEEPDVKMPTVQQVKDTLPGELRGDHRIRNKYHLTAIMLLAAAIEGAVPAISVADMIDYDAETADLIVQLVALGEVRYG